MRVTNTLFLRELIAKLHPPSPATPRESQQLLRLLDTSFRRRLDDAHPAPHISKENEKTQHLGPIASPRASGYHLDSVLQHPLLATHGANDAEDSRLRASLVFAEAVRASRVSSRLIQSCCQLYLKGLKQSGSPASDRILGRRIAAWLSAISASMRSQILTDARVLPELISVMYMDGLEDVVWTWLSMLYERNWGDVHAQPAPTVNLLDVEDAYVSAMARPSIARGALEDAVLQIVKASEYRIASGRATTKQTAEENDLDYRPLLRSWQRITTAILYKRHAHGVLTHAFDALLEYSIPFSLRPTISKGFLMLYHPETKTADVLFQELRPNADRQLWSSWCQTSSPGLRKVLLLAVLDAAELSLAQGRSQQSHFFLDLAHAQWPKLFKAVERSQPAKRLKRAREEAAVQLPLYGLALT